MELLFGKDKQQNQNMELSTKDFFRRKSVLQTLQNKQVFFQKKKKT